MNKKLNTLQIIVVIVFFIISAIFMYKDMGKQSTRYTETYINTYKSSIDGYVRTADFVKGSYFFMAFNDPDSLEYFISQTNNINIIPSVTYIKKEANSFSIIINDTTRHNNRVVSPFFDEFNANPKSY